MDKHTQLYQARKIADSKRQPNFISAIEELHEALQRLNPPRLHPYTLTASDYEALKKLSAYKEVCRGLKCAAACDYSYRISTWPKFVSEINPLSRKWRLIPEGLDEGGAFSYLLNEHSRHDTWLPVSRYIGGMYSGLRGFTWWTTTKMPTADMMCTAHNLGLLNNNVGTETIILRCPVDYIHIQSLSHVPSIIDAYFYNIFYATSDAGCPASGRAISIENPELLKLGGEEFVARPIDVDESRMEVWPLELNDATAHKVYFDDVVESLVEFYSNLGEAENS